MKAKLLESMTTHSTTWRLPLADVLAAFIEPHELEVKGATWWITSGSDENEAAITRQVTATVLHEPEPEARKGRDLASKDDVKALIVEALTERGIVK